MDEITSTIGQVLANELEGFKLMKSRDSLVRATGFGWHAIAIEALPTATPGVAKLAAHAQIRIDEIEALYIPLHPFIDAKAAKFHPTLVANCDSLLGDRSLANGFPADQASITGFSLRYAADLRTNVLPWLNRYSTADALFDGLSDPDPKKWVTSDRLTRYPVLMAVLASRADWARFDQIGTEFVAYCTQRHALVYKPLAEAMLRMRERSQRPQ
jgi:hypothetical protein